MSNKIVKKKDNHDGERRLSLGFKTIKIADKAGKKVKCRELTWTDLAILSAIKGIKCAVFLTFIETPEGIYYAVFVDAFDRKDGPEIYYAIKLGDYNAVAGSYINHDTEETAALWEKLTPSKEVKINE